MPVVDRDWRCGRTLACALLFLVACGERPIPVTPSDIAWVVPGRGWNVAPSADRRTVYFGSIDHEVIAVAKKTGKVRWRATTGVRGPYTAGWNTLVVDDVVVIGDGDLYGFDTATGRLRWTFRGVDGDVVGAGVLDADDGTLFAASSTNHLYAIDARTGTQRWRVRLPGPAQSGAFNPAVRHGLVFVGVTTFATPTTGALVALDVATGAFRWVHQFDGSYPGALYGCLGGAVFHGANVIVAADDGRIYALERHNGAVVWTAPRVHALPPAPGGSYADTRPLAIAGDVLMAGSTHGIVVGLDAATGVERWRVQDRGLSFSGTYYASDERAFYITANGLTVLNAATGEVQRHLGSARETPNHRSQFISPPLIDQRGLFLAGPDGFFAVRTR